MFYTTLLPYLWLGNIQLIHFVKGYKTYKKLLELTEDDSSDVIKKCLRIIKETRHIVEYELWNKIVYFMTDYINGETVWG